ncbi:MAG: hypothetical protein ACM3OB_08005 [Acidobacteriota bacterium]
MRRSTAQADRNREIQLAAVAWAADGAISSASAAAIRDAHPDDRQRLGWVLRALLFVFTWLAIWAGEGMMAAILEPGRDAVGPLLLLAGVGLVVAAELLAGPARLAGFGVDDAVEIAALAHLLVGLGVVAASNLDLPIDAAMVPVLLATLALGLAAAWRYGGIVFGAVAAAGLFGFLAQLPAGRVLWLLAGAVLAFVLPRWSRSARLAPAQRHAARAGLVVALLALYAAVHLASNDHDWVEHLNLGWENTPSSLLPRGLAIAGTALLPALLLAVGVWRRRALLLDLGLLLGAASLVTLRVYVHLGPLWLVLLGSGAALLGAALALRRYLAGGPAGERGGFTAETLYGDARRESALAAAATLATLAPAASPTTPAAGFRGGGGEAGGGGASAEF